jgi:ABC-2 type transport system ATP-binding protein
MAEVEELCDRVAVLNHGRIFAVGTPEELKRLVSGKTVAVIEAKFDRVEDVMDRLEAVYKSYEPATGVVRMRVVMNDWGETAEFVDKITAMGGKILSVVRSMPSFEDVYVKLVGGGDIETGSDA